MGENPIGRTRTRERPSVRTYKRSRWVAKEYNTGPRPDLFSATSPLEGVKLVISEAASSNQKGTVLLVIDVRRAKAKRRVHIELPEGDGGRPGSRQCGLLRKSLYDPVRCSKLGMRGWKLLGGDWLAQGTSEHVPRGISASVHGDDVTVKASREDAEWLI